MNVLEFAHERGAHLAGKRHGGQCSFTLIYARKEEPPYEKAYHERACHFPLKNNSQGCSYVVDVTYNPTRTKDEARKAWINFIINAPAFKGCVSEQTIDEIMEQGYIIINTSVPGNVLAMFCMAHRMVSERPHMIDTFWELIQRGIDEGYAYYLSHILSVKGKSLRRIDPHGSHIPLNAEYMTFKDIKKFLEGAALEEDLEPLYSEKAHYHTVHSIYYSGNWESYKKVYDLFNKGDQEKKEDFNFLFHYEKKEVVKPNNTEYKLNDEVFIQSVKDSFNTIMEA